MYTVVRSLRSGEKDGGFDNLGLVNTSVGDIVK